VEVKGQSSKGHKASATPGLATQQPKKPAVGQPSSESNDSNRAAAKGSKHGASAGGWTEVKGQSPKSQKASASPGFATQQPIAASGSAHAKRAAAAQPSAEYQPKSSAINPSSVANPEPEVEPKKKKKKKVQLEASAPTPPPKFVFEDDFPMLGAAPPVPKAPSARAWASSFVDTDTETDTRALAAATSASESEGWQQVEQKVKKERQKAKSETEANVVQTVQTSKKPKKSKIVNMADLIDVLTLGKPSKGPLKFTNTRASAAKQVSTKSALNTLKVVLTRIHKNQADAGLRILFATDSKVRMFEAVPLVHRLFLQSGFKQVHTKAGPQYIMAADKRDDVLNVLKIIDVQLKGGGHGLNTATDGLLHGKRGKERLKAKKKRPTRLKKIVMAEREHRQLEALQKLRDSLTGDSVLNTIQLFDLKCAIRNNGLRKLSTTIKKGVTVTEVKSVIDAELQALKQQPAPEDDGSPQCSGSSEEAGGYSSACKTADEETPDSEFGDANGDAGDDMLAAPGKEIVLFGTHELQQFIDKRANSTKQPLSHRPRLREYCCAVLTDPIDKLVSTILELLCKFQKRLLINEPHKAKMRQRYVVGLRQTMKQLASKRCKMVIMAPNIEKISSEGGLDSLVDKILTFAEAQQVPVVFCLQRRKLGKLLGVVQGVSALSICSPDGANSEFKTLCTMAELAKEEYQSLYQKKDVLHQEMRRKEDEQKLAKQWEKEEKQRAHQQAIEVARQQKEQKKAERQLAAEQRTQEQMEAKAQRLAAKAAAKAEKAAEVAAEHERNRLLRYEKWAARQATRVPPAPAPTDAYAANYYHACAYNYAHAYNSHRLYGTGYAQGQGYVYDRGYG